MLRLVLVSVGYLCLVLFHSRNTPHQIIMAEDLASAPEAKRARVDALAPVLYSYWRSSSSYRVRIVLALKEIPYEYHPIHLLKDGGQQLTAEYVALNPSKEVPTLVIDGLTLCQSTAIIEYLEETRPDPKLLPSTPGDRAIVRQLCNIISNDIQPVGNLRVLKHVQSFFTDPKEKDAHRMEWAQTHIKHGFEALEAVMAKHSGKYSFGDAVTMADAFLVPQVYNALRFKVDMSAYPTILRVHEALSELPAFKDAHPSAQPDAEKE